MSPQPDSLHDAEHERFHLLVSPHLVHLMRFAQRRLVSDADAEDAVQEACVRAWISLGDLREESKARPWLFRILRSVISDAMEKAVRRRQLVSITRLDDVHESLVGGEPDVVFSELTARLDAELLQEALAMIPEDFATAVELHDLDGFKYHEIAEIVGVPLGTVMSRMSRGRRMLAATIIEHRHAWALGTPSPAAVSMANATSATGGRRRHVPRGPA